MIKEKKELKLATKEYVQVFSKIKKQIKTAQIKAAFSANEELIKLYWLMGKTISEQQEKYGWGSNFLKQLAKDLQSFFPGTGGFSRANLSRIRSFYRHYEKCAQAVHKSNKLPIFRIPWGHNIMIFQRTKTENEMLWYAGKTLEQGWSRRMLEDCIKTNLYKREGSAITNFKTTLPSPYSDIANQTLKDPYLFDFLTLQKGYIEKDLEQGLISHIQKFLLELGEGFAFIGRQYHLEISESDYYIDLLFYHIKLRCFVVIELKTTEFKPEHAGKLNFYLSAVDDLLKGNDDKPTIGLLLCKTKDTFKAEYALRDINKPIGVAEYKAKLVESLPEKLKSNLPTIKEIEAELEKKKALTEKEYHETK